MRPTHWLISTQGAASADKPVAEDKGFAIAPWTAVRRGDEDVSLRALSRDALGESGAQLTSAFFVVTNCVEINQCVGCTRQFFTK